MADSGTDFDYKEIDDFGGGVNSYDSPSRILDNQVQRANNMYLSRMGALTKRDGYSKYVTGVAGSTTNSIFCLKRFYHGGVNKKTVISMRSGTIEKIMYASGASWIEVTSGSTFLSDGGTRFCDYRDYLFILNGVSFDYWDGATATKAAVGFTSGGVTLTPNIMAIHNDRIFIVDKSKNKDELYYSEYDGWTAGAAPTNLWFLTNSNIPIPMRSNDSQGITALYEYPNGGQLIVFRENDVYALTGTSSSDYKLDFVFGGGGALNQESVCCTDYGSMIFVGYGNVYEMAATDSTDNQVTPIGDQIKDKLKGINPKSTRIAYYPEIESILLCLPDGVQVWNARSRGWTPWEGLDISNIVCMSASSDYKKIIFTRYSDGYVYQLWDVHDDDGDDIDFNIETKIYATSQFADFKKFRSVKLSVSSYLEKPCLITFKTDGGAYSTSGTPQVSRNLDKYNQKKWMHTKWAGSSLTTETLILDDNCAGNYYSVKISGSNKKKFILYGIAVEAIVKERRREQ
jgi:hypothetical protein